MMGIYISVPFCKSKCSYCNFASGVFSRDRMQRYVDRLSSELRNAEGTAAALGAQAERAVDSIYLGGGTPTTLTSDQLESVFAAARSCFDMAADAEMTVECAPGTLPGEMVETLVSCGVNRVSLGVQSFNDIETRSVARLHTRAATLTDLETLRSAGIHNVNVDLIAGLPHQTRASWDDSITQVIALGVPHVSVYMLEVDEDSRLGRELIAGGQKYHAHHVPEVDLIADFYESACARLHAAGIEQYEISNFARPGSASRHNLKYWTRQAYFGFGLDAHSMLPTSSDSARTQAVRFANTDDLDVYLNGSSPASHNVGLRESLEEECFLGLRLNEGIDPEAISQRLGVELPFEMREAIDRSIEDGLLSRSAKRIQLTARGRLLSNEVFAQLIDSSPEMLVTR